MKWEVNKYGSTFAVYDGDKKVCYVYGAFEDRTEGEAEKIAHLIADSVNARQSAPAPPDQLWIVCEEYERRARKSFEAADDTLTKGMWLVIANIFRDLLAIASSVKAKANQLPVRGEQQGTAIRIKWPYSSSTAEILHSSSGYVVSPDAPTEPQGGDSKP